MHQQVVDTSTPAGRALFQMMGVFAEFERAMIRERVNAGLARARGEGRIGGRAACRRKWGGASVPGWPGEKALGKQRS